jgi:hypothetical protein
MNQFRRMTRPLLPLMLLGFSVMSIYAPASQAAMISTHQILDQQQIQDTRSKLQQLLDRDSVKQQLSAMGVDSSDIQARVDHMTDDEVAIMAEKMDQLPAGQGIVGTVVFIFLILLITDILGYTNVFPFVKHHN